MRLETVVWSFDQIVRSLSCIVHDHAFLCGRRTEEDAAGMLANMSQSTAVLAAAGGQDPLPDAVQAAQAAGQPITGQVCRACWRCMRQS